MTRRDILVASAGGLLWAADRHDSRLAVEAYIFQQYAQKQHKKLADVLPQAISMAKNAGFRNIELNAEFFAPDIKDRTLDLIGSNQLRMPSVYSGGAMHETRLADETIERALRIGQLCKPFGCAAVVFNANPKGEGVEKTDDELVQQARALNRLGRVLSESGFELRVHNHTPEMIRNAREWRHTLQDTNPQFVSLCLDLDWVRQGGQDPLALLKEAGRRVREIHARNSRDKLWLEALEDGDIDYRQIAAYLKQARLEPLVVVELAYRDNTVVTRSLEQDLSMSRAYAERVFDVKA